MTTTLNDEEWRALAALQRGLEVDQATAARLTELSLAVRTTRGEIRVSGLGSEALTLRKHGFVSSLAKLFEKLQEDVEIEEPAVAATDDDRPELGDTDPEDDREATALIESVQAEPAPLPAPARPSRKGAAKAKR